MSSEREIGDDSEDVEGAEPTDTGSPTPGQSACCGQVSRRRRLVYIALCGVLAVLIALMVAIIIMQVKYLTHEDSGHMNANSTTNSTGHQSIPVTGPTPFTTRDTSRKVPGGISTKQPIPTDPPLQDPPHETISTLSPSSGHVSNLGMLQVQNVSVGTDRTPLPPTEDGKVARGPARRMRPTGRPGGPRDGRKAPFSRTVVPTVPVSVTEGAGKLDVISPIMVNVTPHRIPPGHREHPIWRAPGPGKPKPPNGKHRPHKPKHRYPKASRFRSQLKDTFLWLILSLFVVGVLLVVVTVIVVRYLNARKRRQHTPISFCFSCCLRKNSRNLEGRERQTTGEHAGIPLDNLDSSGRTQQLDAIPEEYSVDSDQSTPRDNGSDDQVSRGTRPANRERTYSVDTDMSRAGSVETNISEPPPYCIAVDLPDTAAITGQPQPPSYDDAMLTGAALPT